MAISSDFLKNFQSHPYHLNEPSPWPVLIAGAVFSMLTSAALWFNSLSGADTTLILGTTSTVFGAILWWTDVTKEGTLAGLHTRIVQQNLSLGVSLFIVTEAFFFLSIFWSYLHSSLAPTIELGSQWPPTAVEALNPFAVPLANTILLVSSGSTITYSHHALLIGNRSHAILGGILTLILAIVFTALQGFEYNTAPFTIADSVFGTVFYFATGFHGVHVIVGTIFIAVGLYRIYSYHATTAHHVGFESSILYWHL